MLRFQYLNEKHRDIIQDFQCLDEPSVAEFLKEEALKLHESKCAITRLYFDGSHNIIGFFTLFNDQVEVSKAQRVKHNWELPSLRFFPAIKIHYLGIDSRYRNRKYGNYLLQEIFDICEEIARQTGCVFITLEALNSAIDFYLHNGFRKLRRDVHFQHMILKIDELEV